MVHGQSLDRASFHQRFAAMTAETRAEFVGGIVHMASPLEYRHGQWDARLGYWLGHYQRFTPAIEAAANTTVQFEDHGEHQPDLLLRIPEERGGSSRIADGFVLGPPELIVEVAVASREFDLGPRKANYQAAGVAE